MSSAAGVQVLKKLPKILKATFREKDVHSFVCTCIRGLRVPGFVRIGENCRSSSDLKKKFGDTQTSRQRYGQP